MVTLSNVKFTISFLVLLVVVISVIQIVCGTKQTESMKKIMKKVTGLMSKKKKEKDEFRHDFDKVYLGRADNMNLYKELAVERFPDTLEGFGYSFDEEGVLKHLETEDRFQFSAKHNDHTYNQMRYEAMGETVTEYVYEVMEVQTQLKKIYIPLDAPPGEPRSFIFVSENVESADKLLILIHGSGAVRAGQWSRKLIINDCLDSGTQLPFIREGIKEGYGIIVMNPNLNQIHVDGKKISIRDNKSPEEHGIYVWKHFVLQYRAQHIAIVAHSFGGIVTLDMINRYTKDFQKRVFAIAFTDSVHSVGRFTTNRDVVDIIVNRAINFVSSYDPLDTPMQVKEYECPCISAGTPEHERTSWSSFDLVFRFIKIKLEERQNKQAGGDQPSPGATVEEAITLNDDHTPDRTHDDDTAERTAPSTHTGEEVRGAHSHPSESSKPDSAQTARETKSDDSADTDSTNKKYVDKEKDVAQNDRTLVEKKDSTADGKEDGAEGGALEKEECTKKDASQSQSNFKFRGVPEIRVEDTSCVIPKDETVKDGGSKERNENRNPPGVAKDENEMNSASKEAKDFEIRKKEDEKTEPSKDEKDENKKEEKDEKKAEL